MSEFQYYEFLAVDHALTREQQQDLRALSSRAEIGSHSFVVTYSYGDFRGDPIKLLATVFDAHVYVANWGTQTLILSFPRSAVNIVDLKPYAIESTMSDVSRVLVEEHGDRVLVTFAFGEEEGGGGWLDEDKVAGWMTSLIPLRASILEGDLRALYIGWLATATANLADGDGETEYAEDDGDDDSDGWADDVRDALGCVEPPTPAGLGELDAALTSLAEFLSLDLGIVAAAAERSAPLTARTVSEPDVEAWVRALPPDEKDRLLVRVLNGDRTVQHEVARRLRESASDGPPEQWDLAPRTVRELVARGKIRVAEREAAMAERLRREREAYLETLAAREGAAWTEVEEDIKLRQGPAYDRAASLLTDLADLAAYRGQEQAFKQQLSLLRQRHATKQTFLRRLDGLGLR